MRLRRYSLLFLSLLAFSSVQARTLPHLDPEMTGPEYRVLLEQLQKQQGFLTKRTDDPLLAILDLGKRNLDWLAAINKNRADQDKLQLTTADSTKAYPIDAPGYSNRDIIQKALADVKTTMPQPMADVIFGTGPIPETNPLDDTTFLEFARQMNHVYEMASRWLLEEPYLDDYKTMAQEDIRGYYFLNNETNLEWNLNHWSSLDADTQTKYSAWLTGECFNSNNYLKACQTKLANAIKKKKVWEYHQNYVADAQRVYNGFFELQNPRPEIIWNSKTPNIMFMPFTTPNTQAVQAWFKSNVEDEWHVNDWHLQINFANKPNLAKVVFEPGATPHVDDLGGDTITMDANRDINEYIVTWTIRHEFGHVLGFPDCYVEFYDAQNEVMINYQIDINNLMCSRRGHLQTQHYDQLKKNYYKD